MFRYIEKTIKDWYLKDHVALLVDGPYISRENIFRKKCFKSAWYFLFFEINLLNNQLY